MSCLLHHAGGATPTVGAVLPFQIATLFGDDLAYLRQDSLQGFFSLANALCLNVALQDHQEVVGQVSVICTSQRLQLLPQFRSESQREWLWASLLSHSVSAQVPPSAFSNSEGLVLSRRSCDQLTRCTQLTWCHRGESESTPGWHRPASFSRKTPPYGRKTSL